MGQAGETFTLDVKCDRFDSTNETGWFHFYNALF